MAASKITLYDILMLVEHYELVDIVYNGYKVVDCKPAGDLCDILEILDDVILKAPVYKISDDYGKIVIHATEGLKRKVSDYE